MPSTVPFSISSNARRPKPSILDGPIVNTSGSGRYFNLNKETWCQKLQGNADPFDE